MRRSRVKVVVKAEVVILELYEYDYSYGGYNICYLLLVLL